MIKLTRIDKSSIIVNENYIESMMEMPDTIITLINGKSYAVKETLDEILILITDYNQKSNKRIQ